MRDNADLEQLYAIIEKSARLAGVEPSRETVWPILTTYRDTLADAVVAFRVATGQRNAGDFDCRFTMLPEDLDPYAVAVEHGLLEKTDHPVGSLLGEIHREFPIEHSGIDFGVVGGFAKTWSFFPHNALQPLTEFVALPSAPPSVAAHLELFTRYGLTDRLSLVGIDYGHKSVNLYFGAAPAEVFSADGLTAILKDAGLPEPSERMTGLGARAFGFYTTHSWDSPDIERITVAAMTPDPTTLPVRIEPAIENFVRNAPFSTDDRQFVYAITSAVSGEYHKLQSYYTWQSHVENTLLVPGND